MTAHKHVYPVGWEPNAEAHDPWEQSNDMTAWRFCPVCGLPFEAHPLLAEPVCTGCQRNYEACPCACIAK